MTLLAALATAALFGILSELVRIRIIMEERE